MSPADSAALTVQDDLETLTRTAADLVVEAASRAWDREFRVACQADPRRAGCLTFFRRIHTDVESSGRGGASIGLTSAWSPPIMLTVTTASLKRSCSAECLSRAHVHRAPVELGTAEQVAQAYEDELRRESSGAGNTPPVFDLVLLGMGSDGHTASLFPGKPSLTQTRRWIVASTAGVLPPPVDRVTLTLPVLNATRAVGFLAAGSAKRAGLEAVLTVPNVFPGKRV